MIVAMRRDSRVSIALSASLVSLALSATRWWWLRDMISQRYGVAGYTRAYRILFLTPCCC